MDDRTSRVPGHRFKGSGDEPEAPAAPQRDGSLAPLPEYQPAKNGSAPARSGSIGTSAQKMAPIGQVEPPKFERPSNKGMIISIAVAVVLIVAVLFTITRLFSCSSDGSTQEAGITVQVHVPEGVTSRTIAEELEQRGIVESASSFMTEVSAQGVDTSLKPGTYQLVTGMDMQELIDTLAAGEKSAASGTVKLTLPEGLTVARTAAAVESTMGIPAQAFLDQAIASNYEADYPFLQGVYDDSLEGYLFPKTYDIREDASADEVIRILLNQYQKEIGGVDLTAAEERGFSQAEIVTMASLIERETSVPDERTTVSSVIHNRLDADMPLQIDAAIQYALGETKPSLSLDDLKVDSPYNVYTNKGLPPGPICSPSRASLEAAAAPADTNYIYYVATGVAGQHSFHEDYESFLRAKDEYKSSQGS